MDYFRLLEWYSLRLYKELTNEIFLLVEIKSTIIIINICCIFFRNLIWGAGDGRVGRILFISHFLKYLAMVFISKL